MHGKFFLSKKALFLIMALGAIIVAALISFIQPTNVSENSSTDISPLFSQSQGRVFVKDLHQHADSLSRKNIESILYNLVSDNGPDLYTATIRPGSYSMNTVAGGQTITTILVDVEPVRLTYSINIISQQDSQSTNISCAPFDQQMSNSNTCMDGSHP